MIDDQEWKRRGACRGLDPEIFYPPEDRMDLVNAAKAVCNGTDTTAPCPVREECLEYALATFTKYGIWGGWGEYERKRMRSRRAAARRRASTRPPGRRDPSRPDHPVAQPPPGPGGAGEA